MARRMLTATHAWTFGGGALATINEPPSVSLPRAEIDTAKGVGNWHTLPDFDAPDADRLAGVIGERPITGVSRGKTLVYNLIAKGDHTGGLAGIEDYIDELRGAFAERGRTGLLVVTPWDGLGSDVWATEARILDFSGDELQSRSPYAQPSPWLRDLLLSLRQIDGRWYWWNESGTLAAPMAFGEGDDAVVVTNSGTAPTEPSIAVAGVTDGDDIHIGRDATSEYPEQSLWFRGLPTGTLSVDFALRTAKVGSTDVTDKLDAADSDWWDPGVPGIPPGNFNVWRGPGAGGALSCSFFSASW